MDVVENIARSVSADISYFAFFAFKSAADEAGGILQKSGKNVIICSNVMPVFNVLDTEPAKNAIRSLFIEKIVDAKGLSKIRDEITGDIIPTPLAVFQGAQLLSKGHDPVKGIGDFLAVDVGGATTDVYSMCTGSPSKPNTVIKGLPEPFAKRSVEGDLGLRYSIESLAVSAIAENIAGDPGIDEPAIREWISVCKNNPGLIPENKTIYKKIDEYLACHAVKTAVERHCGITESFYTPLGETNLLTGKDLTNVPLIIGTGGPVINANDPAAVLEKALFDPSRPQFLKPAAPGFLLDKKYIFAAMGMTGITEPCAALEIMKQEIVKINNTKNTEA